MPTSHDMGRIIRDIFYADFPLNPNWIPEQLCGDEGHAQRAPLHRPKGCRNPAQMAGHAPTFSSPSRAILCLRLEVGVANLIGQARKAAVKKINSTKRFFKLRRIATTGAVALPAQLAARGRTSRLRPSRRYGA
jgi:hypothetical protein